MTRLRLLQTALAAALIFGGGHARAEVQKFMSTCGEKLCPYYQLVLTPPDGWVIDKAATSKNKVQIMVPKGENFGAAPALIYVQAFYHADKQSSRSPISRAPAMRAGSPPSVTPRFPSLPRLSAPTVGRLSCALPLKIRATHSRPMRSGRSAPIPTRTAMNTFSTWC